MGGQRVWPPLMLATRVLLDYMRVGALPVGDRQALLDALGHSADCVDPDHYRKVWQAERDRADGWMRNCSWQPCSQDTDNPCETGWMDGDLSGDEVCPPCWARLSLRDDTGACVGCGTMTNGWFPDGGDLGPGWYCGWCPYVPGGES